jgi:hypothetical protein
MREREKEYIYIDDEKYEFKNVWEALFFVVHTKSYKIPPTPTIKKC